jgi:hypothetical protein
MYTGTEEHKCIRVVTEENCESMKSQKAADRKISCVREGNIATEENCNRVHRGI